MKSIFLFSFLSLTFVVHGEEPWSSDARHPVIRQHKHAVCSHQRKSVFLGFYQQWISSWDGARCPMHPTCSGYAQSAIARFGPIKGFVMATDRLMHEADKQEYFTYRMVNGRRRFVDTLEMNLWR